MYVARKPVFGHYEYFLKESYYEEPYWKSKVILNLGTTPENYITYYSEVAFSIDIEEELEKLGYKVDQWTLERLFFRFLNPEAQRIIIQFTRSQNIKKQRKKYSLKDIHFFDIKRRIVLAFGVSNPEKYINNFYPFLDELCEKSRDELENYFWDLEDHLKYRERIKYITAIFGLSYISSRATQEDIDQIFMENLCTLLNDKNFLMGMESEEIHKNYFCRYIWMYFDMVPFFVKPKDVYIREKEIYLRAFKFLGISPEVLKKASKIELLKIFREKAKEFHPDKGGSHEKFIELRKIFEELLKIK